MTKSFWQQAACHILPPALRETATGLPGIWDILLFRPSPPWFPWSLQKTGRHRLRSALKNISIKLLNKEGRKIFEDFGEMVLPTTVLGLVILSASSYMEGYGTRKYRIIIDLKPALSEEQLDARIQRDFQKYSRKFFQNSLNDCFPKN